MVTELVFETSYLRIRGCYLQLVFGDEQDRVVCVTEG